VTIGIGNWSFGAFVQPLEAEFGWSRAEVSGVSSVGIFAVAACAPLVGWWVDRWGVRTAFVVGALASGAGFAALAYAQELWHFYLLYGLASFFRTLTSYIPLVAIVSRWFPDKRGGPLGLLLGGAGIGGAVFAPLATYLISGWGWRTAFVYLGAVMAGYFVVLAAFVREAPGALRNPITRDARAEPRPAEPSTLLGDAVRTAPFWMLNAAIALTWFTQMAFIIHAQPFMESRGFAPSAAALIVGAAALAPSVARIGLGPAYDAFGRPHFYVLAVCVAGGLSLLVATASTAPAAILLFLALWAIGSGGSALMPALLVAQTYGSRRLGSFLAFTEVTGAAGTLSGPIISGVLFDSTGSYGTAFSVTAVMFVLAGVAFAVFVRTAPRPSPVPVASRLAGGEGVAAPRAAGTDAATTSRAALFGAGMAAGALFAVLWWLAIPTHIARIGRSLVSRAREAARGFVDRDG
jgi:MFS family permease